MRKMTDQEYLEWLETATDEEIQEDISDVLAEINLEEDIHGTE
jgi:hypothetical protein